MKKRKIDNVGDFCKKCNTPVIYKDTKKVRKTFEGYLYCPQCDTIYYHERYRIKEDSKSKLF